MNETESLSVSLDLYAAGAFAGYLALIIGIGIYASRFSSRGISEYFIGGRKMNRVVVALSAVVSGRSAWLLLGVTGMAYAQGPSAIWAAVGYIIVELFLFLYYARRLRNFTERYDCITIPDFFAERFGDDNGRLRSTLVLIFLIFMIGYVSAQFVAGGKAFSSGFGFEMHTGILLTAGIVLVYTLVGGFLAVSLSDMIQAVFMIFSLVLLPVIAIIDFGGLPALLQQISAQDVMFVDPFSLSAGAAIGFLGIGLGSPGNPHILARYMSIDDSKQLKAAALIGTGWNVIMAWGAVFIGLAGRAYFPDVSMLPAGDTENLFPVLAQQHLHPVLFGIVLASIFAAIMSTADSQLLVAASSVVRDIYEKILKKGEHVSQNKLVFLSRMVVLFIVIISLLFGFLAEDLVFWLVLFAWAGLGAAIGPTSILALYWRKTTRAGIFAGLFSGTAVTIVWYYIPLLSELMYELIPGFFASLLATWLVSLYTQAPDDTDQTFKAMLD
ncbi:sodium/proline symporter [Rhodohalobacter mucosus]|uniref:Sodium/proline symporter n=1 Tax=Rhodohalobacter mucosus TaxID=2079485 RepID=A0A316TMK5_9BACT|nr:sodium/proline symporter [Rhodohalobacter mucosus]PWN05843.1 sodium/proline symporter [Rhodohalobacter mucosus]